MSEPASGLAPVHGFAARAIACGVSVIAVAGDGSKRPASPVGRWKKFQEERATSDALRFWFERNPERGVAVVCGSISGNLECLDFDDATAFSEWRELVVQAGLEDVLSSIERGYLEHSPRGVHLLYRCDEIAGATKLASADGKCRIETRGEGNYVITAPSCGTVHETGRPYVQIRGAIESVQRISADERRELFTIARSLDESGQVRAIANERRQSGTVDRTRPGDDWASHHSWRDILEPHGWTPLYTSGEVTYWRRPGKNRGISATTNYAGAGYLHVFTTSTVLEANRSYGKFSIFAHLNHGSDYTAAAKDLREGGYGEDTAPAPDFSGLLQPEAKSDLAFRAIAHIRALHAGELAPVPTPWPSLTKALGGGFLPGVHIIVGGTGVGKTVMMMEFARYAAEQGHIAAIAPLEMGDIETIVRISAEACGVPWGAVLRGAVSASQLARVEEAIERTSNLSIMVGELQTSGFTPSNLEALCAEAAKGSVDGKTPLIILDFVQLMGAEPGERSGDLRQQIRTAAYAARSAAVRHSCSIIMVSSVGRHGYGIVGGSADALKRAGVEFVSEIHGGLFGAEPTVKHKVNGVESLIGLGKESGELEYAATTVSVLTKIPSIRNGVAFAIAKHRYLYPSWVPFRFENGSYETLSHDEELAMVRVRSAVESSGSDFGGELRDAVLDFVEGNPWCSYRKVQDSAGAAVRSVGGKVGKSAIERMVADLIHSGEIITTEGPRGATLHALRNTSPNLAADCPATVPGSVPRGSAGPLDHDCPQSQGGPEGAPGPGRSVGGEVGEVESFVAANPGCSKAAVERALDMSRTLVRRAIQELLDSGALVERASQGRGNAAGLNLAGTSPEPRRTSPNLADNLAATNLADCPATVPRGSAARSLDEAGEDDL